MLYFSSYDNITCFHLYLLGTSPTLGSSPSPSGDGRWEVGDGVGVVVSLLHFTYRKTRNCSHMTPCVSKATEA